MDGVGWDDELNTERKKFFKKRLKDLERVGEISVPQCIYFPGYLWVESHTCEVFITWI